MQKIVNLTCPGCGGAASTGDKECKFCHRPIVITTFNNVASMSLPEVNKYAATYKKVLSEDPDNLELNVSIAMCYIKLKLYNKAAAAFEKAIEDNFDNSETYFYLAISLLEGKKAFVLSRSVIDKIEEYINAALMVEPKGIYYYFQAYIKYDYFKRKFFNTNPTYQECLEQADNAGLSPTDIHQLYEILNVERPECL